MKTNGKDSKKNKKRTVAPAKTVEGRESQLIALAEDAAEKKLRNNTASSQLIVHYLKRGSKREKLEKDILEEQKKLLEAKTDSLKSAKRAEELYEEALNALKVYNGTGEDDDYDE